MTTDLQFTWCESIGSIPRREWDQCFQKPSFARSYSYQQAVEAAAPEGASFHYLIVRQSGAVLAIIGCFRYQLPLAVTATGTVRRIISGIERWLPGLFTIDAFCVGQLTAVCDHLFGLDAVAAEQRATVVQESKQRICDRAREFGCALTMIKEVPASEIDFYAQVLADSYIIVDSLPNTVLQFDLSQPYIAQLRSKYRNLYKKRTRAFRDRGLTWEIVYGSIEPDQACEMERLYRRVLERSVNQFERLSAAFFSEVCSNCESSFAILCWDRDTLVGFSLNIEDPERICGLYLGYEDDDGSGQIYFNLLYKLIDIAHSRGKGRLQLGQTSYEVKSALGALPSRNYLALHSQSRIGHHLLGKLTEQLFPPTAFPQRTVFARRAQPSTQAVVA